jgi:hypothetical protein
VTKVVSYAAHESARPSLLALLSSITAFSHHAATLGDLLLPNFPPRELAPLASHLLTIRTARPDAAVHSRLIKAVIARSAPEDADNRFDLSLDWGSALHCLSLGVDAKLFAALVLWCVDRSPTFETAFIAHFSELKRQLASLRAPTAVTDLTNAYLDCAFRRRDPQLLINIYPNGMWASPEVSLERLFPRLDADCGWMWPLVVHFAAGARGEAFCAHLLPVLPRELVLEKFADSIATIRARIEGGAMVELPLARLLKLVMTKKPELVQKLTEELRLDQIALLKHFSSQLAIDIKTAVDASDRNSVRKE